MENRRQDDLEMPKIRAEMATLREEFAVFSTESRKSHELLRLELQHVRQQCEEMLSQIRSVDHFIHGNGNPGVKVVVDRLQQNDHRRSRREWLFGSLVAALLAERLLHAFLGG